MECPNCKHQLIIQELNQVEVDHCHNCGGIWLDSGELETLTDHKLRNFNFTNASTKEKKRRCPICRKTMKKIYPDGTDEAVIIDICPEGHGLWFDAKELNVVVEKLSATNNKVAELLSEMFKNII